MDFVIYAGFQMCACVCVRERGKENVINLLVFSPKGLPRLKNLPARAEDQYSCLDNLVGCSPWGRTESDMTEAT